LSCLTAGLTSTPEFCASKGVAIAAAQAQTAIFDDLFNQASYRPAFWDLCLSRLARVEETWLTGQDKNQNLGTSERF
jgi:hypothetical protein